MTPPLDPHPPRMRCYSSLSIGPYTATSVAIAIVAMVMVNFLEYSYSRGSPMVGYPRVTEGLSEG